MGVSAVVVAWHTGEAEASATAKTMTAETAAKKRIVACLRGRGLTIRGVVQTASETSRALYSVRQSVPWARFKIVNAFPCDCGRESN
jgi:hypothetical protein